MIKAFFSGLLHFNPDNSEVTAYAYHPNDEDSLGEGEVSDILKDKQGRIWVVTTKGDLNLYENGHFTKFKYTSLTSEELGLGYYCQLIQSRNGSIWLVGAGIKQNQLPPIVLQFDLELKEFQKVNLKLSKDKLFVLDKEINILLTLFLNRSKSHYYLGNDTYATLPYCSKCALTESLSACGGRFSR